MAKLSGGVAILRVGAATEIEMKEKKQRVEDEYVEFENRRLVSVLKFLNYFVETLRKNNIVWGVGRGSSVASYCLYLLGVHKIDSIKYNLDMESYFIEFQQKLLSE